MVHLGVGVRVLSTMMGGRIVEAVEDGAALPPGVEVELLGPREYSLSMPGMSEPLRVTTDPSYFDEHPGSTELWSPGSPLFPAPDEVAEPEALAGFTTLNELVEKS